MSAKTALIKFRVSPEMKVRLEDAAGGPRDLSEFIRVRLEASLEKVEGQEADVTAVGSVHADNIVDEAADSQDLLERRDFQGADEFEAEPEDRVPFVGSDASTPTPTVCVRANFHRAGAFCRSCGKIGV